MRGTGGAYTMASHEAMHVARREADDARASCAGQDAVGARINQGINTPPPIPDFDPRQMADAANVHLFIHDQTATNLGSGGHSPRGPSAERPRARSPPTGSPRSNPRARSPPPRGAVAGAAAVSLEEFAGIVDRKKMEKEEVRTAPPLCPTRRRLGCSGLRDGGGAGRGWDGIGAAGRARCSCGSRGERPPMLFFRPSLPVAARQVQGSSEIANGPPGFCRTSRSRWH